MSSLSEAAGGAGTDAGPLGAAGAAPAEETRSWWQMLLARMRREDRESYACYVLMVRSASRLITEPLVLLMLSL